MIKFKKISKDRYDAYENDKLININKDRLFIGLDLKRDILSFKTKIKSYAEVLELASFFRNEDLLIENEIIVDGFNKYFKNEVSFDEFEYFCHLLKELKLINFNSKEAEDSYKYFASKINNLDSDKFKNEINEFYRRFLNVAKPFKEKDLTDEEIMQFLESNADLKESSLDKETIENFRYGLEKLLAKENIDAIFLYGRIMYGDSYSFGYKQDFKVALDCYLKAGENGIAQGYVNAAYIYYYDRLNTGKKDYKKAYEYFKNAAILEYNWNAIYKLSDMYKNGFYVEQNKEFAFNILKNIFFSSYQEYKNKLLNPNNSFPEIAVRYYELAYELNKTDVLKNIKPLIDAYLNQKEKVETYDHYGQQTVLKHIANVIGKICSKEQIKKLYEEEVVPGINVEENVLIKMEGMENVKILKFLGKRFLHDPIIGDIPIYDFYEVNENNYNSKIFDKDNYITLDYDLIKDLNVTFERCDFAKNLYINKKLLENGYETIDSEEQYFKFLRILKDSSDFKIEIYSNEHLVIFRFDSLDGEYEIHCNVIEGLMNVTSIESFAMGFNLTLDNEFGFDIIVDDIPVGKIKSKNPYFKRTRDFEEFSC